ncbi:MAG TPA: four helix bundle protein [Anaerolineales bacterium]|nr:four helix bundle protein [Anaerolineales bacterium]
MKDFRQLKVWEKAHQVALAIYKATKEFPKEELYGLTSQIRRASMSIPTNISEGCGRNTDAEFARFLQIAMGSASETEYQLLLSHDLGFLNKEQYDKLNIEVTEVKRMLASLLKTLRADR